MLPEVFDEKVLLKLDEPTHLKAEKARQKLKMPRKTYFLRAVSYYNALCTRKRSERKYRKASGRFGTLHLEYLKETERLEGFPDERRWE